GALTDGQTINSNKFWQQPTTTGWQNIKRLEIDIDLSTEESLESITFNTARGESSDVHYPRNVLAFVSEDNQDFEYVGDIVADSLNRSGAYEVKKFSLDNINKSGKYVKLVVVPNGKYVFCDEIEIIRGGQQLLGVFQKGKRVSKDNLDKEVNSLVESSNKLTQIRSALNKMNFSTNDGDVSKLEDELLDARVKRLNSEFRSEFVVEKINPWEKLDVFHFPVTDNSIIKYDYSVLIGGVQFGGVLITNTTDKTINLEIEQTKDLEIYQAPRISTLTNAYNVDPLVPIVSNTTSIPAG